MLYLADEMFKQKDKEISWFSGNRFPGKPLIKQDLHWNGQNG